MSLWWFKEISKQINETEGKALSSSRMSGNKYRKNDGATHSSMDAQNSGENVMRDRIFT